MKIRTTNLQESKTVKDVELGKLFTVENNDFIYARVKDVRSSEGIPVVVLGCLNRPGYIPEYIRLESHVRIKEIYGYLEFTD